MPNRKHILSMERLGGLVMGLFLVLVMACATSNGRLRVIQTTDVHGYFGDPEEENGTGGLRQLEVVVEDAKSAGWPVLLLDSGDMWSGTLLSDSNTGELGVRLFNALGYGAAALGNHEFDYGSEKGNREGGEDPFGVLRRNIRNANFPVLAANLRDRTTGAFPAWKNLKPSVLINRGGFRIGLIGLITAETPSITFPYVGEGLEFTDPIEAVRQEAPRLRAAGAELIFVVAHIGGGCTRFDDPDDLSHCIPDTPIFTLVRSLPKGTIDAVFGGHTHMPVAHRVAGVPIIQAGRYAAQIGTLDVTRTADGGIEFKIHPPRPLRVQGNRGKTGPVSKILDTFEAKTAAARGRKLGVILKEPLDRVFTESSALGSFLCDTLLQMVPGREICILNSGGLRHDLAAGELTYGRLYDVMPFGNMVAELDIKGSELREFLRITTSGGHGVSQIAGLRVEYEPGRDACPSKDRDGDGEIGKTDRDRLISVTLADGSPIDPDRIYKLVTSSFLARGGDSLLGLIKGMNPERVRVRYDLGPMRERFVQWFTDPARKGQILERPKDYGERLRAVGTTKTGFKCSD